MNRADYEPFIGDGRVKVYPPAVRVLGTGRPVAVTNAVARRIIDEFQRHGTSVHSPQLSTLWVLVTWCRTQEKRFEVWRWDLGGYSIHLDSIPEGVSQKGGNKVLSNEDK